VEHSVLTESSLSGPMEIQLFRAADFNIQVFNRG